MPVAIVRNLPVPSKERFGITIESEFLMKLNCLILLGSLVLPAVAAGDDAPESRLAYHIMRNGSQIGTSTITIKTDAQATLVQIATHIEVKFAFVVLYRFDQTEDERWTSDGRLLALDASTNDNGAQHVIKADACEGAMSVQTDGVTRKVGAETIPMSLWNSTVLAERPALIPQDGTVVPLKVVDRGADVLSIHGASTRAHHYQVTTTFPEDVWYDSNHRLIKLELTGRDGSLVLYQLV